MMKKQDEASQTMPRGFDSSAGLMQHNLEMATDMFRPFLAANISLLNWNANNCKRMGQACSQWFDFVGHRLEEEASLAQQLQTTKDPERLSNACSKFLDTAAQDYQNEVSELTKLTSGLANDATDALQDVSVGKENGATSADWVTVPVP